MAKKPFAVRVEDELRNRFKALSTVLNVDDDKLLEVMVTAQVETLTDDQKAAYEALLKVWKSE